MHICSLDVEYVKPQWQVQGTLVKGQLAADIIKLHGCNMPRLSFLVEKGDRSIHIDIKCHPRLKDGYIILGIPFCRESFAEAVPKIQHFIGDGGRRPIRVDGARLNPAADPAGNKGRGSYSAGCR